MIILFLVSGSDKSNKNADPDCNTDTYVMVLKKLPDHFKLLGLPFIGT